MTSVVKVNRPVLIKSAYRAYKYLNGLMSVYKPPQMSLNSLIAAIKVNISKGRQVIYSVHQGSNNKVDNCLTDLNELDQNDAQPMVRIASEDNKTFSVDLIPNLAQDILSTGPRFPADMPRIYSADTLGFNTSGVLGTTSLLFNCRIFACFDVLIKLLFAFLSHQYWA